MITSDDMTTEIGQDLKKAKEILEKAGLVAIPTETVYGLAANALNEQAIISVFQVKARPRFNPLIVHLKSYTEIVKYTKDVPPIVFKIAEEFTPGPLTFLLKKTNIVSDIVTAGSPLVALRVPRHNLTLELLNSLSFPLVAPSANPFTYVSPTSAEHVYNNLHGKIPYILDGGECNIGIESTIIGFEQINDSAPGVKIVVYRKGGFDLTKLQKYNLQIDFIKTSTSEKNSETENVNSPGQLKVHYSPNIPCYFGKVKTLCDELQTKNNSVKIGIISFSEIYTGNGIVVCRALSKEKSIEIAAKNVFKILREMENEDIDLLILEPIPNIGIGEAINDRLQRAAAKYT